MAGKRKRENRRKRRREKGRNGAGGGSPTRRVGEGVEEAQSSVEIGSSLAASTAVPTIPTLPPAGTRVDDSIPLQSLRTFVGGIIDKVWGFIGGIPHSEDGADEMQEATDGREDGLEKKISATLDNILGIRDRAIKEENLERSERFRAAYERLAAYLKKLQTTDTN